MNDLNFTQDLYLIPHEAGWVRTAPPKDGSPIVAKGNVTLHEGDGMTVEPFEAVVHWNADSEEWCRWGGLALKMELSDEVTIHVWMPVVQATGAVAQAEITDRNNAEHFRQPEGCAKHEQSEANVCVTSLPAPAAELLEKVYQVPLGHDLRVRVTVEIFQDNCLPVPLEAPNWEMIQCSHLQAFAAFCALYRARQLEDYEAPALPVSAK